VSLEHIGRLDHVVVDRNQDHIVHCDGHRGSSMALGDAGGESDS
jgi:hypothetical protein